MRERQVGKWETKYPGFFFLKKGKIWEFRIIIKISCDQKKQDGYKKNQI